MDILSNGLHMNKLQLNVSKTKYITFVPVNKSTNTNLTILFRNCKIDQVETQKFLGIWFRTDLSWNTHVEKLCSELSKTVGCLFKIASLIPLWLKKLLYYTLFYSKLSYCSLVWGTTTAHNYNKLIILQKKVLRIFENYHGRIQDLRTHDLFSKHGLLKASQVYYYKLLQYIRNNNLYNHYTPQPASRYCLRGKLRKTPQIRTNYGKQHTDFQIPWLLNKIEENYDCSRLLSNKFIKKMLLELCIEYS